MNDLGLLPFLALLDGRAVDLAVGLGLDIVDELSASGLLLAWRLRRVDTIVC